MSSETTCWQLLPIHLPGESWRTRHTSVIPAQAGIHASQKTQFLYVFTMGPCLRGDDAAAHLDAPFYLQIGVNCRF